MPLHVAAQRLAGLDTRQSPAVPRWCRGRVCRGGSSDRRRGYRVRSGRRRSLSTPRPQLISELVAAFLLQPHFLQPGAITGLPAALEFPLGPQRSSGRRRSLLLFLPLPFFLLVFAIPLTPTASSSEAVFPLSGAHQGLGSVHLSSSTSSAESSGGASSGLRRHSQGVRRGPGARLPFLGMQHAVLPPPQSPATAATLPLAAL